MTTTLTRTQARRRYAIIAIGIPLAVFVALMIVQFALLPQLPDPVASHWGLSGEPDGFSEPWLLPLVTGGVGFVVTLVVALAPYLADAAPEQLVRGGPMSYRLMAAIVWAETGFVGSLMLVTFVTQIGIDDARDATLPGWWALVGLAVGAILALAAWRVVAEPPRADAAPQEPSPLVLGDAEHAVWITTVSMSRTGLILVWTLIVAALATTVVVAWAQIGGPADAGILIAAGVLILLALLVAANTVFRVRIDGHGLEVRSRVGWPRVRIPRERIRSASVVSVNPMGEYGGWGWRYSVNSGWGVIMRTGEAIRVLRTDGRAFTVTVDDAETGASLLNGLIARDGGKGTGR